MDVAAPRDQTLAEERVNGLTHLVGGASYTIGIPFFLWSRQPYAHAVWHIFVLGGSISHFFAALFHLPPV